YVPVSWRTQVSSDQANIPAASLFFGILLLPLIVMSFSSGSSATTDNDLHGHVPNSFPAIATPTWSPDPFTTTSITFVVLSGLTENVKARTAAQALQLLVLGNVFCKVSAGGSAEIDVFIDGLDGGLGARVVNSAFSETTIFLASPSVFADTATHTVDLRVEVNSALTTFSAQAVDPLAFSAISYLSVLDLGTGPPITP